MTNEVMTVHKALCELKTLNDRIDKAIRALVPVFANKHSNTKVFGVEISAYCDEIKNDYKAVKDLMARRDAIKAAVTQSNATTTVNIGGKEYTVAVAIDMKNNVIPLKRTLLNRLIYSSNRARADADNSNGDVLNMQADKHIEVIFGKNADVKAEEIKTTRNAFIAAQTVEVVDPIGITEEIAKLDKEINDFFVNVDSALSVSNATTEITIEY